MYLLTQVFLVLTCLGTLSWENNFYLRLNRRLRTYLPHFVTCAYICVQAWILCVTLEVTDSFQSDTFSISRTWCFGLGLACLHLS